MGDVSANFSRHEFACPDNCGFDAVDIELLNHLEDVRHYFGKPITINSGCRCAIHNAHVNGSLKSQHMRGKAVDIVVQGVNPIIVADYFDTLFPDKYGLGKYDSWTHFDVRAGKARWDLRGTSTGAEG
jgi:uncharacterized protein YcbK (DUF882 family)